MTKEDGRWRGILVQIVLSLLTCFSFLWVVVRCLRGALFQSFLGGRQALFAALDISLFEKLSGKELTVEELSAIELGSTDLLQLETLQGLLIFRQICSLEGGLSDPNRAYLEAAVRRIQSHASRVTCRVHPPYRCHIL
jgi:hypothetical protein